MKFIKRLIILSGEKNKGTLMFEKNAHGVFVKLNSYGAPIKDAFLSMLIDKKKFGNHVSSAQFNLKGIETVDIVHAAVFCGDRLIMYGTNENKRMPHQEIMRLKPAQKKNASYNDAAPDKAERQNIFSKREELSQIKKENNQEIQKPINNEKSEKYYDDAIAESNYYPPTTETEIDIKEKTVLKLFGQENENDKQEQLENIMDEHTRNHILKRVAAAAQSDSVIQAVDLNEAVIPPLAQESDKEEKQDFTLLDSFDFVDLTSDNQEKDSIDADIKTGYENGHYPCKLAYSYIMNSNNFIKHLPKEQKKEIPVQNDMERLQEKEHKSQESNTEICQDIKEPKQDVKEPKQIKQSAPQSKKSEKVASINNDKRVKARSGTFYERNGDEIERLFSGEREKELENLLPNSRWVRIDYNGTGKYYVIGIIGKEYLCYGVPAVYTPAPPKELNGYCWWFPLKPSEPQGKGYWIMYQNLTTGETVFPPKQ